MVIIMILDTIARSTLLRVAQAKEKLNLSELKSMIYNNGGVKSFNNRKPFAFEKALKSSDNMAFICEVKKASPSKGIIADDFPYLEIAKAYEEAGADAISVLTEPEYFQGDNSYLTEISSAVNIPVLRKDFTLDEYQIYEAKVIGADAVLLICSLLDTNTIRRYISLCDELNLSALVEAHTEKEIAAALAAGARVIGVNNRNLQTFEVDINNSIRLRQYVPKDICFVAESGIRTAADIKSLETVGVNAVLIGETLMKSSDKKKSLSQLRGA
jgi:indole-3-glycerol phosphate synthase